MIRPNQQSDFDSIFFSAMKLRLHCVAPTHVVFVNLLPRRWQWTLNVFTFAQVRVSLLPLFTILFHKFSLFSVFNVWRRTFSVHKHITEIALLVSSRAPQPNMYQTSHIDLVCYTQNFISFVSFVPSHLDLVSHLHASNYLLQTRTSLVFFHLSAATTATSKPI